MAGPSVAAADAHLPVSESTEITFAGDLEAIQTVDLTLLHRPLLLAEGAGTTYLASGFQSDLHYGLLDRLEVGFGISYTASEFEDVADGLRQHAKLQLVPPGDFFFDIALAGEVAEREHALEIEARVIARAVFDRVHVVGNVGGEFDRFWSSSRPSEGVLAGSLATTVEVVPELTVGIEGWIRAREVRGEPDPGEQAYRGQVLVGPVALLSLGKVWLSVGAYARATEWKRDAEASDRYGRYWVRTLVGFDL